MMENPKLTEPEVMDVSGISKKLPGTIEVVDTVKDYLGFQPHLGRYDIARDTPDDMLFPGERSRRNNGGIARPRMQGNGHNLYR